MPVDISTELQLAYLRAAQASQREDEDKIIIYRNFFDGEQGVVLSDRQKEYLTKSPESFANICKRTVNIPKDKLEIKEGGLSPQDDDGQEYSDLVTDWWTANQLNAKQKDVYEASLRDGVGALIVGWDEARDIPTFTQNLIYDGTTGQIRFHYDNDGELLFASKRFTVWNPLIPGLTGRRRLTIYRPGAIERYEFNAAWPDGWRPLRPEEIDGVPNPQPWTDNGAFSGEPLGIPVIPFDNPSGSELADVINIQELLNHSLATFDIATDYHGFPLIWLALGPDVNLPIDPATGQKVYPAFRPGASFDVGEGGRAGRIEPADLERMFKSGILSWVQVLAIVKGWPYFLFDKTAQPPSGISLQVLERPLVSQVEDKQAVFGEAWRKAFDVARQLYQLKTGQQLPGDLNITWRDPRTVDKVSDAEATAKRAEALKLPIVTLWREAGYSEEDIERMKGEKEMEGDGFFAGDTVTGVTQ